MSVYKVEICGVNTAKLPLLSNEKKQELFTRILAGDQQAREEYIKGNLRLVLSVIQRFAGNHPEHVDDLFQIGCIGLMKAVDNFDITQGVQFSTYAVPMNMRCQNSKKSRRCAIFNTSVPGNPPASDTKAPDPPALPDGCSCRPPYIISRHHQRRWPSWR